MSDAFFVACFCRARAESRTDSQAELEAARIAGLSQASLVCRLNSLAYLLDALATQDTTVRAWWYEVRSGVCTLRPGLASVCNPDADLVLASARMHDSASSGCVPCVSSVRQRLTISPPSLPSYGCQCLCLSRGTMRLRSMSCLAGLFDMH